MKKLFKNRAFRLLFVAVLVLSVSSVYTAVLANNGQSSATSNIAGVITTPMQWIATKVDSWIDSLLQRPESDAMQELKDQVSALEEQLKNSNEQLINYHELQKENERLKNALEFKENYPELSVVGASVVATDPSDPFYGFTINKGTYAGISVGDAVVTQDGLVGIVTRVSTVYAKVSTVFDPDVKVSCYGLQSDDYGILKGDKQYADQNRVQLTHLDTNAAVRAGDLIVTSGLGGVYPKGLVVGYVKDVVSNNVDISLTAIVEPGAKITSLTDVIVITDFPGKGEVAEDLNNP